MMTKDLVNSKINPRRAAGSNPLYIRVREYILHDMVTGNFTPGDRYLTETELSKQMNVCRNTVRKAMEDLEDEGYITRHRRIGTIIQKTPLSQNQAESGDSQGKVRQRLVVMLPWWNDSVEGFYTGKLLTALSSPTLSPQFAVEIRHHNDSITQIDDKDTAVVTIDPELNVFTDLQQMAREGRRIIVIEPRQPIPGLVNLFTDRRGIVCKAVKDFYALGHKSVGMINSSLVHLDYERSLLGYLDAHRELDIPIPPQGIVQYSSYVDVHTKPDVINISAWVCTYLSAVNLVAEQCRLNNLTIPEDVSLISLDDPGDVTMASVGKKVSVAHNDPEAAAKLIHTYLNDWREDRCGTMTFIPSRWKDRETIAPPKKN